jgi:hypothetical protein
MERKHDRTKCSAQRWPSCQKAKIAGQRVVARLKVKIFAHRTRIKQDHACIVDRLLMRATFAQRHLIPTVGCDVQLAAHRDRLEELITSQQQAERDARPATELVDGLSESSACRCIEPMPGSKVSTSSLVAMLDGVSVRHATEAACIASLKLSAQPFIAQKGILHVDLIFRKISRIDAPKRATQRRAVCTSHHLSRDLVHHKRSGADDVFDLRCRV